MSDICELISFDNIENNVEDTDDSVDDYDSYDYNMYNCSEITDDLNEEESNENNIYTNDPEYFDYECYSLEKIDWIVEKKCEKLIEKMSLEDPIDALFLLKKFKWNTNKIIDIYEQDNKAFRNTYISDKNNNNDIGMKNDKKITSDGEYNRSMLLSYVNIFNEDSKIFTNIDYKKEEKIPLNLSKNFDTYCEICCTNLLNVDLDMAAALDECSHYFCQECWRAHFESLINESFWDRYSATSKTFQCMQTKCKTVANKDFVIKCLKYNVNNNEDSYSAGNKSFNGSNATSEKKELIKSTTINSHRNLQKRYRELVALDLIKESDDIQICPGDIVVEEENRESKADKGIKTTYDSYLFNQSPTQSSKLSQIEKKECHLSCSYSNKPIKIEIPTKISTLSCKCNSIVWIKSKQASRRVECKFCSTKYCFTCLLPYHAPNSCAIIKKWLAKCQDDSETRNYLLVHTQDCPKCRVCIEKNGGCSHMTCNRCKHEFCWVCSNDWKSHGASYDCNRYKGNPEQDNAREALNRYTHYYHRWINHSNSLKFEKAFKEECQNKIQEKIMKNDGGTLVDWEFLAEAVENLTRARFTLQYTYPYAYYLEENESKKLLFENIQAQLERDVENLSHNLENVSLNDKFNIETQMNIVEKRRKTLLLDFIN